GWSIAWQGGLGEITPGTTILAGIQQAVDPTTVIDYRIDADFDPAVKSTVGIVVVGETPYAEGVGDTADIRLSAEDVALIQKMRQHCDQLVALVISGRPMVITEALPLAEAWVAVWWLGTEGAGVADVLFGDAPFVGKSAYTWPRSMEHIALDDVLQHPERVLFPFGHGLMLG
ncbi:MAG: glycoside hydrolase family 3 protein, partial [Phototrophicaceae bacterium]